VAAAGGLTPEAVAVLEVIALLLVHQVAVLRQKVN